jgi:hypothetical protein
MIFQGFISGFYVHRSRSVDFQECTNWYPEVTNPDAKNNLILSPTPGTVLFGDLGTGKKIRGIYYSTTNRLFAVSNNFFFEINESGTSVVRGQISTRTGQVYMTDNGIQLIIVDGDRGFIFDFASNSYELITTEGFPNSCTHVQFVNGRFVVNSTDTNQFNLHWSAPYDGTSWSTLDVASTEGYADKLTSMAKSNNQLWLFGELSTEVFWDTGDADQPYQRLQGAFFDNGTAAPNSTASTGNTVFWVGSNAQGHGIIWMASTYQPQRISNHAIEFLLQSMPRIDDAIGYCYQQDGHSFYVVTFPTNNTTLVYDMTTNFWHERATYNNVALRNDRHVGNCSCYGFNKTLLGSKDDGKIYYFDKNVFTDDGRIIRRIRTSPHISKENKRMFYKCLELDIEKGQGLQTGQGTRPDIALQHSNDGGYTWSSELWRTSGRTGRFNTRVKWYNLGAGRDKLFRVIYSDPTPCTLINAYLDVDSEL